MLKGEYFSKHAAILGGRCTVCREYTSLCSAMIVAEVGKAHLSSGLEAAVSANGGINVRNDLAGIVKGG